MASRPDRLDRSRWLLSRHYFREEVSQNSNVCAGVIAATVALQSPGLSFDLLLAKQTFKQALLRWHPDKFLHRFRGRIAEQEATSILQRVLFVSQQINAEWQKINETHN